MRKRFTPTATGAAVAAIAAITASVAVAGTVTGSDGSSLTANAKIKPKKLSKKALSPASIEIATKTSDPAGTLNPATKAVMDFDKNGTYLAKGLPICNEKVLAAKNEEEAKKLCGKAMIGSGLAVATAAFFEQPPLPVKAKLFAFNGVPKGGKPTVVIYAYATEPAPFSYVFSGVVSKRTKEGFGTRFEIDFPILFGGSGAIREFNLNIGRKFNSKGKKRSLVSAKCPGSKKLKARIAFTYKDGETIAAPVTQTCKQRG